MAEAVLARPAPAPGDDGATRRAAAARPRPWAWLGLWLLLSLGCAAALLVNNGPIVFGDSMGYVMSAAVLRPLLNERIFGYSVFLRLSGVFLWAWLPLLLQAAMAAWLTVRLLSLEARSWPARWRAPLALGFCAMLLAGHLPWLTAYLMPDLLGGLTAVALLLLAMHWPRLRWPERLLLAAFLAGAATTHLTNPALLIGIAALCVAIASWRFARPVAPVAWRLAGVSLAAAAIGLGLLCAANRITYGVATPAIGGPVFLLGRLQADMDAPRILRPRCEQGAGFAICGVLDRMAAAPMDFDTFLFSRNWDPKGPSPVEELGGWGGFRAEAGVLNGTLLRAGWRDWLAASAGRAAGLMTAFDLGGGMTPRGARLMAGTLASHEERLGIAGDLGPVARAVGGTRQAEDTLLPRMPRALADALGAAGLVGTAGMLAFGLARRRPELWWPALLLAALWIGNVAVSALGSEVHARHGQRLVWVAPLLAGLLAVRAVVASRRPAGPPGRSG